MDTQNLSLDTYSRSSKLADFATFYIARDSVSVIGQRLYYLVYCRFVPIKYQSKCNKMLLSLSQRSVMFSRNLILQFTCESVTR